MSKEIIKTESWYQDLLLDLKKIEFGSIVMGKWHIGKRILEDELKFGKPEYGSKRIENIARDLNTSKNDLWCCIQFAKKFHAVKQFESKSWRHIANNLLPEPRKEIETPELPKGKYQVIY